LRIWIICNNVIDSHPFRSDWHDGCRWSKRIKEKVDGKMDKCFRKMNYVTDGEFAGTCFRQLFI